MYFLSVGDVHCNPNIEYVETDDKKVPLYEVIFNGEICKVPEPIFNVWRALLIGEEYHIAKEIWIKETKQSEHTLNIVLAALMEKGIMRVVGEEENQLRDLIPEENEDFTFELSPLEKIVLSYVDGKKSVIEIYKKAKGYIEEQDDFTKAFTGLCKKNKLRFLKSK